MMFVIDKYVPNVFPMHSGGLKSSKLTPDTTGPNLITEAQKHYENCYAWSFCYDFVRRVL